MNVRVLGAGLSCRACMEHFVVLPSAKEGANLSQDCALHRRLSHDIKDLHKFKEVLKEIVKKYSAKIAITKIDVLWCT